MFAPQSYSSTHRTENILGCGGRGVMPARPGSGPAVHVGKRGKLTIANIAHLPTHIGNASHLVHTKESFR